MNKHIYFFAHYNLDCPSVRYRGKYFLEELKQKKGYTYSFVFPEYSFQNILNFILIIFEVLFFRKKNSILVFQKIYSNKIYANILKILVWFHPENTCYDIDDAEYLRFSPSTIHYFMKNCSIVMVGSEALKKYTLKYNSNVVINTSPVLCHDFKKEKKPEIFTIGWLGYFNAHQDSFKEILFPALKKLRIPLKLVLMGVRFDFQREWIQKQFEHSPHIQLDIPKQINWKNENEIYNKISEWSIGVSPLLPTAFNEARSAFKLKQYLSCGLPVLASPVGENLRFVKCGKNGYWCSSSDFFYDKILYFYCLEEKLAKNYTRSALNTQPEFSYENFIEVFERATDWTIPVLIGHSIENNVKI